jgi:hypothetical protein
MSQGKSSGNQAGIVSEARTGRMARVAVKMKRPDPNGNRRSRRAYVSLHKIRVKK